MFARAPVGRCTEENKLQLERSFFVPAVAVPNPLYRHGQWKEAFRHGQTLEYFSNCANCPLFRSISLLSREAGARTVKRYRLVPLGWCRCWCWCFTIKGISVTQRCAKEAKVGGSVVPCVRVLCFRGFCVFCCCVFSV